MTSPRDGTPAREDTADPAASSATEGETASPVASAAVETGREGGRTPLARRHDDPQRIEGAGRWSVDATRRRCHHCGGSLPDRHPFHSVLEPAPADSPGAESPGVGESELFVRRDYCEECFAASPPAISFAHWRSILPPPPGGVRKVVNLASLLAHFHALVETPAAEEDDPASDIRSSPLGAVETGRGGSEGLPAGDSGSDASRPAEARARLSYLLALFLVRRRMLRWEGVEAGILRLRCRESDRPVELAVPEMTPAELDAAISEFESLFA